MKVPLPCYMTTTSKEFPEGGNKIIILKQENVPYIASPGVHKA